MDALKTVICRCCFCVLSGWAASRSSHIQSIQRRITHRQTHASRLPIESSTYQLTLKAQCVNSHSLKCLHPTPVYAYASWAVIGYYWDVWNAHWLCRLPFIPDTVSDGCVGGPVEGGRPGHSRLFQSRSVARIHGVRALHVPVVVPVGVWVPPVFDFDRGPGLSPKMLWRF